MNRCLFLALVLLAATHVDRATLAQPPDGDAAGTTDVDRLFIKAAAVDNSCEMQLAQIALKKAQSQDVKQLARLILHDRQQVDQQLRQVAQKTGMQIPQQLPQMMQEEATALSQLRGEDFDKQFVSFVKANHAKGISRFGDESKIAKSDDVKQFAARQLPVLQKQGETVTACAAAEGLGTEGLDSARPAAATLSPSALDQQGTYRPHHNPPAGQQPQTTTPDNAH